MDFMDMETSQVRRDLHIIPLPEIPMLTNRIVKLWKLQCDTIISNPIEFNNLRSSSKREEEPTERFLLKFSLRFSKFHIHSYQLHQTTSILLYLKKILQVAGNILRYVASIKERIKYLDIKWYSLWYCSFSSTSMLCRNIFALSNKLWTVSCCAL